MASLFGCDPDLTWQRYCGFLDLSPEEFSQIQDELLAEQLHLLAGSALGRRLLGDHRPTRADEFRRLVPLTSYEDYAPDFNQKREDVLIEKPYAWCYTADNNGGYKWVPYTRRALDDFVDKLMAAFILSSAQRKGEVGLQEGDRILYNIAPRPYLTGLAAFILADRFNVQSVLPMDAMEGLGFEARIDEGFKRALAGDVDIVVSLSGVLAKIADHFANRSRKLDLSAYLRNPAAFMRIFKAVVRSRLQRRPILPKDLWSVKGVVCWGMDTSVFREKIERAWGKALYQFHACTEARMVAMQSWRKSGMTFVPDTNFLEFIPEEEWLQSRCNPGYQPRTLLLNEVEAGCRYELVITSFHGMPFVRYRVGQMVRILMRQEQKDDTDIPQMVFDGRADDVVDIGGFIRLSESTVTQALESSGVSYEDWVLRKEWNNGNPVLHLYIEPKDDTMRDGLEERIHRSLKKCDPFYRDLDMMLNIRPLKLTFLSRGTFGRHRKARVARFPKDRVLRMNAAEDDLESLLSFAGEGKLQ